MNGAQALFKALVDAGLDTCFANPGHVRDARRRADGHRNVDQP